MQLAVAPATHPTPHHALFDQRARAGAAAPFFSAARAAHDEVRGDLVRGVGGFMVAARPALLLLAACALSGCTQLAGAYRAYDSAFEREIVAGHDDARGNYAEIRWSPRSGDGKAVLR